MAIAQIILFGTGSPVLVDVQESMYRVGVSTPVAIRNRPDASYLSAATPDPDDVDREPGADRRRRHPWFPNHPGNFVRRGRPTGYHHPVSGNGCGAGAPSG
jgi:hypothetical protein